MNTESRKKKLQEAGKSHFFFTFSQQPAWDGEDTSPWGSARGRRERAPALAPPMPQVHPDIMEVHSLGLISHL